MLRSNKQAVEVGDSDVLGRCLYWGNLFIIPGIVCAQLLAVWVLTGLTVGIRAADRRNSDHNEQKNERSAKRTKSQKCKMSDMVVRSSPDVT